jgi:hypothetical protein
VIVGLAAKGLKAKQDRTGFALPIEEELKKAA